jgi:hypothetical protein
MSDELSLELVAPSPAFEMLEVAAALEDAEEEIRFAEPDSRAPDDATM